MLHSFDCELWSVGEGTVLQYQIFRTSHLLQNSVYYFCFDIHLWSVEIVPFLSCMSSRTISSGHLFLSLPFEWANKIFAHSWPHSLCTRGTSVHVWSFEIYLICLPGPFLVDIFSCLSHPNELTKCLHIPGPIPCAQEVPLFTHEASKYILYVFQDHFLWTSLPVSPIRMS